MKYLFLMIFAGLILAACSTNHINYNQLIPLKPGMSKAEVIKVIDRDTVNFQINSNSGNYDVLRYTKMTGQHTEHYSTHSGSNLSGMRTTTHHRDNYNMNAHFYILFKNDKLVYMGFLHEFLRVDDPEMQDIGTRIYDYINAEDR